MIEVRNLHYAWRHAAGETLAIEQFTVADGEAVFVHGPSGCGKSTLLGLLAGVLAPQRGTVSWRDDVVSAWRGSRRDAWRADHVGIIFQQFNLVPYLSVVDNVLLPCRFSKRRAQRAGDAAEAARALLAQVALPADHFGKPASALSVGQQQRVAAARALIGRPEIVIADEPTSALDAALRDEFMALLLGQCRAHGSTLVFVSHDERLAARFDRRVALPALNRAPGGGAGGAAAA